MARRFPIIIDTIRRIQIRGEENWAVVQVYQLNKVQNIHAEINKDKVVEMKTEIRINNRSKGDI